MFEIFGALFGGAYLLGKAASDKSAHRSAQDWGSNYKMIYDTITNPSIEKKLADSLYYKFPQDILCGLAELTAERHNEICQSVINTRNYVIHEIIPSKDMEYVFGKDWESYFEKVPTDYDALQEPKTMSYWGGVWDIVLNIWLSTKGYASWQHVSHGYYITGSVPYIMNDDVPRVTQRACDVIARNVREHHPELSGIGLHTGRAPTDCGCVLRWDFGAW